MIRNVNTDRILQTAQGRHLLVAEALQPVSSYAAFQFTAMLCFCFPAHGTTRTL